MASEGAKFARPEHGRQDMLGCTVTDSDHLGFDDDGYVFVPGGFGRAQADDMADAIWEHLRGQGIERDDPTTWRRPGGGTMSSLTKNGRLAITDGPALDAVNDLCGTGAARVAWGQPLVTFPSPGPNWAVPREAWHTEANAAAGATRSPGVLVLWFINAVRAGGGGTLIVSGSHRLVNVNGRRALRSAGIRKGYLGRDPWLRRLLTSDDRDGLLDSEAEVDGVPLRVVELTGEPGDVVIVDQWVLHTASPNRLSIPRLMGRGLAMRAATAA